MKLILARIGEHQTVRYAFDELIRYLKAVDDSLYIEGRAYEQYVSSKADVLWIGLDGSVPASTDDEIKISVKEGSGIITGSNERSVLIGVYRFLYELGCRWIRPGDDGELIVKKHLEPESLNIQVAEKASYRHRAVCIEGMNSYEHVFNIINWLPKVGMNGYYVQFRIPFCFFQDRYRNEDLPVFATKSLELNDVKHIWKQLEEEIVKRSLLYHAVGHGWTCEPFGIKGNGWKEEDGVISSEVKQYFAEIDGKRELWDGIALNTNLCYSNPHVRDKMTNSIVDYCKNNPKVDYLHFWLADGMNNHCECAECQKMRPSDYYVLTLNELEQKLSGENIHTKIVFLLYVDLLWEPEHYKIEHPERFVMMFAPITRTYTKSFTNLHINKNIELADYKRNKLVIPQSVNENIAHLMRWQKKFEGDSFDFDYHLMWDHVLDPGYYECAHILHEDMVNLDKIGLNGMVSCQVQRASFPTGLPMYSMAKALWDKQSKFESVVSDYFTSSFGKDGKMVAEYMKTLSDLFHPPYMRFELEQKNEEIAVDFAKVKEVIEVFKVSYIEQNIEKGNSWKYLFYHAEYCIILADMLKSRALGDKENEKQKMKELKDYLKHIEPFTHSVLDVQNCCHVMERFQ